MWFIDNLDIISVGLVLSGLIYWGGIRGICRYLAPHIKKTEIGGFAAFGLTVALLPTIFISVKFDFYSDPNLSRYEVVALFFAVLIGLSLLVALISGIATIYNKTRKVLFSLLGILVAGFLSFYVFMRVQARIDSLASGQRVMGTVENMKAHRKGMLEYSLKSPDGIITKEVNLWVLPACPPDACPMVLDQSGQMAYSTHSVFLVASITGLLFCISLTLMFFIHLINFRETKALSGILRNRALLKSNPVYAIFGIAFVLTGVGTLLMFILPFFPNANF